MAKMLLGKYGNTTIFNNKSIKTVNFLSNNVFRKKFL